MTVVPDGGAGATGAHAVLAALSRAGVRRLHGVPGHGAYALYDAINDVAGIEPVVARHEQGAGFAAVGEAWATGDLAALTFVPRAGLANAATALMEATASQDRVLAVVAEEDGQHRLAREVARHHVRAAADAPLGPQVDSLLAAMRRGRPGAAVLEVPTAALAATQAAGDPRGDAPERPSPTDDAEASALVAAARRPVILAGATATALASAGGDPPGGPVARLAEAIGAPLLADGFASGLLPAGHPLAVPPGWAPGGAAARIVADADLVIVVGAPLAAAQNTVRWNPAMLADADPDRVLLVDWDDDDQHAAEGRRLHGPVPEILAALAGARAPAGGGPAPGWDEGLLSAARSAATPWLGALGSDARAWLAALVDALGARDGVVLADSLVGVWLHRVLAPRAPRRLRFPWGTGTLGAALPAAIGAKLARPDAEVTAIAGDGAFLYTASELATLRQAEIPLVVIVANDGAYGAVRDNLGAAYGRSTVHELVNPDFVALAEAFGVAAERCERPGALARALETARRRPGPSLIEIPLTLHPPRGVFA